MARKRDDFSATTKRNLARRVGYRCSKPGCGKATDGPHEDQEKYTSIGVAAHITAASEGGPRYDATLTAKERKGIHNGIWLCELDATLIDKNPGRFTIAILLAWKADAETRARARLDGINGLRNELIVKQISESMALMKIEKYKRKCSWGVHHSVRKLLDKIERFSYIESQCLVEEVVAICIGIMEDEEYKRIDSMESTSFLVLHCLMKFIRYGKVIIPGSNYTAMVEDITAASVRYVAYQSTLNPERIPSATILSLIKFVYQRLGQIDDLKGQTDINDKLEELAVEIDESKSAHHHTYLKLVRQYQRNISDFDLSIPPFED